MYTLHICKRLFVSERSPCDYQQAQCNRFALCALVLDQAKADSYSVIFLSGLGGSANSANSINNSGKVVGSAQTLGNLHTHAVAWNGGVITDLVRPLDTSDNRAYGINQSGQIIGTSATKQGSNNAKAPGWFTPSSTKVQVLTGDPSNGTASDSAYGINNAEQAVG
jgi:probable HAF family extracellular repeat protein